MWNIFLSQAEGQPNAAAGNRLGSGLKAVYYRSEPPISGCALQEAEEEGEEASPMGSQAEDEWQEVQGGSIGTG